MSTNHLFSILVITYERTALLKESVDALLNQKYGNLEIILINNGGTPENIEYLHAVQKTDKRIKLLHFNKHHYEEDDPMMMFPVCVDPALHKATGDYVFFQNDDDILARDYVERMVNLFKGNSKCITAAGIPVSIDSNGKVMSTKYAPVCYNFRPPYMPGHLLVQDHLRGGFMYDAPGTIFSIKRDVLIKAGGYPRAIETSQLYGIVPFGVTGFDENAVLYWRRHEGQLNKQLSSDGFIGFEQTFLLLKEWNIEKRWADSFGHDMAKEVVSTIKEQLFRTASNWFCVNLVLLRFKGAFRILKLVWSQPAFWFVVPHDLWKRKKDLLLLLKPSIKAIFDRYPGLSDISPWFNRLHDRVKK